MDRYFITDICAGCGGCSRVCPSHCVDATAHPARIDQSRCTGCGLCAAACPIRAIKKETP